MFFVVSYRGLAHVCDLVLGCIEHLEVSNFYNSRMAQCKQWALRFAYMLTNHSVVITKQPPPIVLAKNDRDPKSPRWSKYTFDVQIKLFIGIQIHIGWYFFTGF